MKEQDIRNKLNWQGPLIVLTMEDYREDREAIWAEEAPQLKAIGPEIVAPDGWQWGGKTDEDWLDERRIPHSGRWSICRYADEKNENQQQAWCYVKLLGFGAKDTDPQEKQPNMPMKQKIAIKMGRATVPIKAEELVASNWSPVEDWS